MKTMKPLRTLLILVAALSAPPAFAATTLQLQGPAAVKPNTETVYAIRARISEAINTVGFTVTYDPALVSSITFVPGDSVVGQWLRRSGDPGSIRVEGIIPGGTAPVLDDTVPLGYLRLRFARPGTAVLAFAESEIYLHQPVPTRDIVTAPPLRVTVTEDASAPEARTPSSPADAYVRVLRDDALMDGHWAVIADIRDAAGPVATFRLRERWLGLFGSWRELSSPATLSDQLRMSILEVGVPDGDGMRILYRETPARLIALAVFAALAVGYIVRRRMHR